MELTPREMAHILEERAEALANELRDPDYSVRRAQRLHTEFVCIVEEIDTLLWPIENNENGFDRVAPEEKEEDGTQT